MPAKSHIHQYIRAKQRVRSEGAGNGLTAYYKCADVDCSHYLHQDLILGKRSICNRCGKEFILPNATRMLGLKPHCKACTKGKEVAA